MFTLEQSWRQCFADMGGLQPPSHVWAALLARYGETHRAYHTTQHLAECFDWFEQVRAHATRPGELAFALFYHDAIYDTHASDNEERSAQLAANILAEYVGGDSHSERVVDLILATKQDTIPKSEDANLLVDIDLSILGCERARFDEYERQIRLEYQWVPAEAFREGRRRVLTQFLGRSTIYDTDYFRERLEATARENLRHSLKVLDTSD
jgi:predicted metal-dependent HD superfamily phosphohydrolase